MTKKITRSKLNEVIRREIKKATEKAARKERLTEAVRNAVKKALLSEVDAAATVTPLTVKVLAATVALIEPVWFIVAEIDAPRSAVLALVMLATEIVSPAFAPTWKAALEKVPSSSLMSLKVVCEATRSTSAIS